MSRTRPGACGHTRSGSAEFYLRALNFGMDLRPSWAEGFGHGADTQSHQMPTVRSLMSLVLAPGDKGPRSLRERLDPFTTSEVAGWLNGELQPPK
jgi:hypothetical protein